MRVPYVRSAQQVSSRLCTTKLYTRSCVRARAPQQHLVRWMNACDRCAPIETKTCIHAVQPNDACGRQRRSLEVRHGSDSVCTQQCIPSMIDEVPLCDARSNKGTLVFHVMSQHAKLRHRGWLPQSVKPMTARLFGARTDVNTSFMRNQARHVCCRL